MTNLNCQNCKTPFTIAPEDFAFYSRIKVPPPTWCPDCRNMRRLAYRNERVLYSRNCDLCKKAIISIYPKDSEYIVYCPACWNSDKWDAKDYGRDFDFSKPFFPQFAQLLKSVPRNALLSSNCVNSDYCNSCDGLKDSYLAICSFFGERNMYTYFLGWCNDCVDSYYILNSNMCYACQDITKSFNCRYVYRSDNMIDSVFCLECFNCQNCFGCVGLRNKNFCINNEQYTQEEYFKEIKKYNLTDAKVVSELEASLFKRAASLPRPYSHIRNCEDVIGDYIKDSKNVFYGFDVFGHENTRYVYDSADSKDCADSIQAGLSCELMYEAHDGSFLYNTKVTNCCWHDNNSEYLDSCNNNDDLFGCVGLRYSKHCIFNKQYSPKEYSALKAKIVDHMRKTGEYGSYFPIEMSTHKYNETAAQQWYPQSREEVLKKGWLWQDNLPGTFGKKTGTVDEFNLESSSDEICKAVFACFCDGCGFCRQSNQENCGKNYKIVKAEFEFYKKMQVPLPTFCPDCRYYRGMDKRNPRKLWPRECRCDLAGHKDHSSGARCNNNFQTSYAPDRPEKIFCLECYKEEVV